MSLHLLPNLSLHLPWYICMPKSINIFLLFNVLQWHLEATGITKFDAYKHSTYVCMQPSWLHLTVHDTGRTQQNKEPSKVSVSVVPTNFLQSVTWPTISTPTKPPYNDNISMKDMRLNAMAKLPLLLVPHTAPHGHHHVAFSAAWPGTQPYHYDPKVDAVLLLHLPTWCFPAPKLLPYAAAAYTNHIG